MYYRLRVGRKRDRERERERERGREREGEETIGEKDTTGKLIKRLNER